MKKQQQQNRLKKTLESIQMCFAHIHRLFIHCAFKHATNSRDFLQTSNKRKKKKTPNVGRTLELATNFIQFVFNHFIWHPTAKHILNPLYYYTLELIPIKKFTHFFLPYFSVLYIHSIPSAFKTSCLQLILSVFTSRIFHHVLTQEKLNLRLGWCIQATEL